MSAAECAQVRRFTQPCANSDRRQNETRNLVTTFRAIRTTVRCMSVLMLAAWISMCCCDRRALAELIFPPVDGASAAGVDSCCAAAIPSCCSAAKPSTTRPPCCQGDTDSDSCCSESSNESSDDDAPKSNCCTGACCVKLSIVQPPIHVPVDCIGAALPAALVFDSALLVSVSNEGALRSNDLHRSDGEPPPRHRLVLTARFLI